MAKASSVAVAVLGAWLGASLLMWFVAAGSFSTVDRVLRRAPPEFAQSIAPMGVRQARLALRYLASEINRTCFRAYGWSQLVLGVALVLLLVRQSPRETASLVMAGLMLGLVLLLTLGVMPEIVRLGRSLDFVPRSPPPPEMNRFQMLHTAYTILDAAKVLIGAGLLVRLLTSA